MKLNHQEVEPLQQTSLYIYV